MIRKHFRIRRIVLGLAFAAILAPSAQAMTPGTYADGASLGTYKSQSSTNVRTPEIQAGIVPTLSQGQVEALRYQAMVDAYTRQTPVRSENSFGAPGPSAAGAQGPVSVQTASTVRSDRFDWSDAGIGGSIVFGAALMLLTAVGLGRRHHRTLAGV
jgi:hypothetical protein